MIKRGLCLQSESIFFEYSNLDNIFFSPLCYNNNNYSSEKSTANESIINMKRYYISYLSAAIFIVYGPFLQN